MQLTDLSKARARHLRRVMTSAERKLWLALRDRRFLGLKVRRQVPIGPYVVDFYCADHRLIIDADSPGLGGARDFARDEWLCAHGFRILSLRKPDILRNLSSALDLIAAAVQPIDPSAPI
jgi:very-short-patch-repair endonuclease